MSDKHLSSQFDAALNMLSTHLLAMGGMVERQITRCLTLLDDYDPALVQEIRDSERELNALEIEIDEEIHRVIARRQPAARDLRLLMAMSKCVTNLERMGDEARKISKRLRRIDENGGTSVIPLAELRSSGEMAASVLHRVLDAFARMDAVAAAQIVRDDKAIDEAFRAFVRRLVTQMSESPHTVSIALEYLFIAKALERIGDHAKNIAEFVVFVVKGRDVRHIPLGELEREALAN
ncbi:phosphate signaling complex protein PhoU [Paraburkholderia sp. Tr-20389]|uniref:phosphate signaling complex protein PhoU n=1 Tax=Paraburkholderia sp. Tr-20389 TaxID=2703903 RepID=UPI0019818100|nr:phosphate signaling complex protein PhoU [Paraburkholderia sp. Tr-20389]MBN3752385.1 phosphate signaling complex protein PhoU [Paraburkholderia sp. Tr-20389]